MIRDTLASQDAFIHQIWISYKDYRRYAPGSIPIQETSLEVKVTVTQGRYVTLCHPKMHADTKYGIPTSNNIRDMLRTRLLKNIADKHGTRSGTDDGVTEGQCDYYMPPKDRLGALT